MDFFSLLSFLSLRLAFANSFCDFGMFSLFTSLVSYAGICVCASLSLSLTVCVFGCTLPMCPVCPVYVLSVYVLNLLSLTGTECSGVYVTSPTIVRQRQLSWKYVRCQLVP